MSDIRDVAATTTQAISVSFFIISPLGSGSATRHCDNATTRNAVPGMWQKKMAPSEARPVVRGLGTL